MAKITSQRARKPYKCEKCEAAIMPGELYYRAAIPFKENMVRCVNCKPRRYETSNSEYVRFIGKLKHEWESCYPKTEKNTYKEIIREIASNVEDMQIETELSFSTLSDGLQASDMGRTIEDRIDVLDTLTVKLKTLSDKNLSDSECAKELQAIMENIDFDY